MFAAKDYKGLEGEGTALIATEQGSDEGSGLHGMAPGLFFLFAKGKRPTSAAIRILLDEVPRCTVSHDPARPAGAVAMRSGREGANGSDDWLELLVDGLTFDLLGLAPGPPLAAPPLVHRFNCPVELAPESVEAVALVPGPHLAGGANTLPVVRTLVGLGAEFAERLTDIEAVSWSPARSAIAPPVFVRNADAWLDGGPFPALGLAGFALDEDGLLRSEGLSFFIGQEIILDAALSSDPIAGTRLAAHIVHELVGAGTLDQEIAIAEADSVPVQLRPSADGRWIAVSRK